MERLKNSAAWIKILMAHSRIFEILLKPIVAMIPKHDLILMICSPIMQI
jgi:hypothetical protein